MFYHQRTNTHDFIPIFVFVTDFVTVFVTNFVKKFVTSISYQIFCLLGTFCHPKLQIPNHNQLGHSIGIVGTCLGHIWYPQTLKRERNPYISVKLLLNSKRRIFWKFSKVCFYIYMISNWKVVTFWGVATSSSSPPLCDQNLIPTISMVF